MYATVNELEPARFSWMKVEPNSAFIRQIGCNKPDGVGFDLWDVVCEPLDQNLYAVIVLFWNSMVLTVCNAVCCVYPTKKGRSPYGYAVPLVNHHYSSFDNGPFRPSAATRYFKSRQREIFDEPSRVIIMRSHEVPEYGPTGVVTSRRRRRASSLPPRHTRRDQEVDEYLMGLDTRRRFYDDTYLYGAPRRAYHSYVHPYLPYPTLPRPAYTPVRYDVDYDAYEVQMLNRVLLGSFKSDT